MPALDKCNTIKSSLVDSDAGDLLSGWICVFFLPRATENRSWLRSHRALLAGRRRLALMNALCACETNRRTHPHGWRDAPGAGLAVTEPEGAAVPGDGRVELQLMPLFLEGRRTRKDCHWPYSQLGLLLLYCIMYCIQRDGGGGVYALVCQAASCHTDGGHSSLAEDPVKNVIFSYAYVTADD